MRRRQKENSRRVLTPGRLEYVREEVERLKENLDKRGYTGERNENKQRKYGAERAQTVFQDNIAQRGNRRADKE